MKIKYVMIRLICSIITTAESEVTFAIKKKNKDLRNRGVFSGQSQHQCQSVHIISAHNQGFAHVAFSFLVF